MRDSRPVGEEAHNDTLDLPDEGLEALLARVGAMAAQEITATRSGPVFDRPLSAVQLEEVLDGAAPLPLDGEPLEDLLERCRALLGAGDGRAYLSNAVVDGRFALRACITNFQTTRDDVERTLALVRELGDRVAPQRR